MKTTKIIVALTVTTLAFGVAGCKEETKSATEQTKEAAATVGDTMAKTVETAKDAGAKVVADVTDKAKELAAPASAKAQELIAAAKNLVGEGKFQEALTKLKDIGSEKLSVDQQAVVDGLKAQIEKALGAGTKATTDAANAAAGLLPKN
jgi:hypothetical protein